MANKKFSDEKLISESKGINYGKAKAKELADKYSKVDAIGILNGIENKNKALQGHSIEDLFKSKPAEDSLKMAGR